MVDTVHPLSMLALQRRCNELSAGRWELFGEHRRRVTDAAVAAGGGTLAVLGAGNCNDLDLPRLAGHFRKIHLFDLDRQALLTAMAREPAAVSGRTVVHAPVDLSGVLHEMVWLRGLRLTDQELAFLPAKMVDNVLGAVPDRFDTVVSSCLLSQLLHGAAIALGPDHPDLTILSCVIALAHVRCLISILAPGGTAVLITDMASSERVEELERASGSDLDRLAHELEAEHRAASGTGPVFLRRLLEDDRVITPLLAGPPQSLAPWLWRFGHQDHYLVHGFAFRRRADPLF
jgi:hypothetical protein